MRRLLVVLATSLGILGIAGGGQIAGAAPTDKAIRACERQGGTYTTSSFGYTCTNSAGFTKQQVNQGNRICFKDEGGTTFENNTPPTFYFCQTSGV
jgi:hypothetical protein